MPNPVPPAELLRALGRLARGLSALFWGLPITLVVCVQTVYTNWLDSLANLGFIPPSAATALLYYGLWQLGHFQRQERVWVLSLDRAKLLGLINIGLSPFLYWLHKLPEVSLYSQAVAVLMLSGLLFLFNLNQVLQRLTAMLPDETLRAETKLFTSVNLYLLLGIPSLLAIRFAFAQIPRLPGFLVDLMALLEPMAQWLLLLLVLLPVAMTMTLIWKIKEMVFSSVFGQEHC